MTTSPVLQRSSAEPVYSRRLRVTFWIPALLLASLQIWTNRFYTVADAFAYLDMSDGVLPGFVWKRFVNGTESPLYPLIIGVARRLFHPPATLEIQFAHFLNLPIFIFAAGCFEFLMQSVFRANLQPRETRGSALPEWACLGTGYSIFLWVSLAKITVQTVRPDLLMSGFVYLAAGLLVRMKNQAPKWQLYLSLGAVLGVGYLAKSPMLPLGLLMIAASLFMVQNWRRAMLPATVSILLMFAIGSFYFVPLSHDRGYFTTGESGKLNYLQDVDQSPDWYMDNVGRGEGNLQHPDTRIFDAIPTYRFSWSYPVTHPLRFDPAYWMMGAHPRFYLSGQLAAVRDAFHVYARLFEQSGAMLVIFFVLLALSPEKREVWRLWPVWGLGLAGLGMYSLLHVEERYVGASMVLLWVGLICGMQPGWKHEESSRGKPLLVAVVAAIAISLLAPMVEGFIYAANPHTEGMPDNLYRHGAPSGIAAGVELKKLGLCPGDAVARIENDNTHYGWARVARVSIVAEVDYRGANQFWAADPQLQQQVLRAMATTGAKVVVADNGPTAMPPPGWERIGNTRYLLYRLARLQSGCGPITNSVRVAASP